MKIKKLLTMLCLIVVSIMGLFGCATIESVRVVNPDYSIIDQFVITLDKNKLGYKYNDVRNSVKSDLYTFTWHISDWIDGFKEDYREIHEVLKSGITYSILGSNDANSDNELGVTIKFAGIEYFRIFYGLECVTEELQDAMNSEMYNKAMTDIGPFISKICSDDYSTEEMGLFLYKYYLFSDNGILAGIEDYAIGNSQSYYDKYSTMTSYTLDDVELSQSFTYPDDRIKCNADEVEVIGGMTFMTWNLSDKEDGFEMEMYYVGARTTAWYVLALGVSAIAVIIIFFVIWKKHKNDISVIITKQEIEKNER